jgi:carboxymethylenebutenolidase
MKRATACVIAWLLVGCNGPTAPAPPGAAPASSVSPADADGSATPHTGAVSEEEFKRLHELTGEAAPAPRGETIDLAGGKAYLSLPEGETPDGGWPAVLVIHEWWGLGGHIRHFADRLAAEGYAALAVDLYGGKVATTPDEAMQLVKSVDEARAKEILAAGHRFLGEDARVSASKRGVIGWCFGGGWSLQHAIATPDLDAAVIYYGRLVDDEQQLAKIRADVLAIFGNEDESIPPEAVDRFEAAMKQAGRSITVQRYDANHAFANPSSARYDQSAAGDAWEHTRKFFAEHLR